MAVFVTFSLGRERMRMLLRLGLYLGVLGLLTAVALVLGPHLTLPSWLVPDPKASTETTVLGWTCSVLNVCMYASPLGVVRTVIAQRSVKTMPLLLTIGTGICSSCWTVYALMSGPDWFILVPNLLGLGLFALQLAVYNHYAPLRTLMRAAAVHGPPSAAKRITAGRESLMSDTDNEAGHGAAGDEPLASPIADDGRAGSGSSDGGGAPGRM